MVFFDSSVVLKVAARASKLSQIQVKEVLNLVQQHFPAVEFETTYLLSTGDKNKHVSLREQEKTDFFTKELDELVIKKHVDIAVHSAKDLPDPLPAGLTCVALTKGLNPIDSLVMAADRPIKTIATSSVRRECFVKNLFPDACFVDIRGTIEERLAQIEHQIVDAVVIAEAALIRLGLTDRPRIFLEGCTTPMQGQLAIIAHEENVQMADLFRSLDCRQAKIFEDRALSLPEQK